MDQKEIFEKELIFSEWCKFYKELFEIDFKKREIFKKNLIRGDFKRLIVMAEGLTLNKAYEVCTKHFSCEKFDGNLDELVTINDRDPKHGSYVILSRNGIEADNKYKNLSAKMLWEKGIFGMTLLERTILNLKHYFETKQHLDVCYWTCCSGSCKKDGSVIVAGSCGKTDFEIRSLSKDNISSDYRVREVILI